MLTFDPKNHTYTLDGEILPSVTQVISKAGLNGDAAAYYTDLSALRGTAVHRMTELIDAGTLDRANLDPRLDGYLRAYDAFRREQRFEPLIQETPLGSRIYGFAGTLDRICWINDRLALLDYKSGRWQRWHDVQLAAYDLLARENAAALGIDGSEIEFRAVLTLGDNGKYQLHPMKFSMTQASSVFLGALQICKWKEAA